MRQPARILIRTPNWIGDQILAYPFFYFLRQMYPKAEITALCNPSVQAIQFKELVDQVLVLPSIRINHPPNLGERYQTLKTQIQTIRAHGPWDLTYCLPNSFSSAWLLFRVGAQKRCGYRTDFRGWLLNKPRSWKKARLEHRAEAYVQLLRSEQGAPLPSKIAIRDFWGIPPTNDLDPGIPGVAESFNAAQAWWGFTPIEPPRQPYWILAPGANAVSRRWPAERFKRLAQAIGRKTGWLLLIVGGPAEAEMSRRMVLELGEESPELSVINLSDQGEVARYWKLFQYSKISICNDSGLAHVAALCGSPVQIVWGAGNLTRTQPLGPGKVKIHLNPVDCWPCEQNSCSQSAERHLQCLNGISVDELWRGIQAEFKI